MQIINDFKKEGYETNLIHIALRSPDESFERVNLRKNLGGHSVDAYSIKLNFEKGTENLIKHASQFDRTIIYDNSLNQNGLTPLILIQRGEVVQTRNPMPEHHKPLIAEIINNLPPKPEQTKKKGLGL
jgi:predicted ABC-type ATPase